MLVQGQRADAGSVIDRLRKPSPFIQGDYGQRRGNVCFYADFSDGILPSCQGGRKTCLIDSNGILDFVGNTPSRCSLCDGVMLDMKAIDDDFHRQLTGAPNRQVLDNLTPSLEAGVGRSPHGAGRRLNFLNKNQKTVGGNERS